MRQSETKLEKNQAISSSSSSLSRPWFLPEEEMFDDSSFVLSRRLAVSNGSFSFHFSSQRKMSYPASRRHGRTSNPYSSVSPTRRRGRRRREFDDDFDDERALEEEIVDRALRIERRREEIFREQFHFLVSNVKVNDRLDFLR